MSTRIALVPLDERPVNTKYPQMIARIAGSEVLLPPVEAMGQQRSPADAVAVGSWLRGVCDAGHADAAAVSADFLAYGNLINSRISHESATDVLARLDVLGRIGSKTAVHVFSLITRVANANNDVEEPLYWREWGARFYEFASLAHRAQVSESDPAGECRLTQLSEQLPSQFRSDWLVRRLRNHIVNLALVDMAARGKIASLLLTSDDTSPYGFPTRERDWIASWLALIAQTDSRITMHPGADEVGSVLTARLVNDSLGGRPRVWVEYDTPASQEIVAPYEDRPVRDTIAGQIDACGCAKATGVDACDFVLAVATPSPRRSDYRVEYLDQDRADRGPAYDAFIARLADLQRAGIPVALADVAYPNGSDPALSEKLLGEQCALEPSRLAAYGAWNTAGNTLGTVVAQASCAIKAGADPERVQAQNLFLAHRFLEDYGYQQRVRREARAYCDAQFGATEPETADESQQAAVCRFIEERLTMVLGELQRRGIGRGLHLTPGSVRLPWRRTFEVDFVLEASLPP